MSLNHDIACDDCRERLWVAQVNGDKQTFYSGEAHTMVCLGRFLFEHRGHRLRYDYYECIEMEWNENPLPGRRGRIA